MKKRPLLHLAATAVAVAGAALLAVPIPGLVFLGLAGIGFTFVRGHFDREHPHAYGRLA